MSKRTNDQADTLRKLMRQRKETGHAFEGGPHDDGPSPAPVITVSSGKGGVGKSCLVANVGARLARSGLRVLLVDGDFGLANLDILFGVRVSATMEQVLSGEARLREAIIGIEPNLWLLPACSGLMSFRDADALTRSRMAGLLGGMPWEMDVILVDLGAGIQSDVLGMHSPLYHSVVVLTPEPTSLTDAYGLIKLLRRDRGLTRVSAVVNQVTDAAEARLAYRKLKEVADRFTDIELEYLGYWQRDEKITQAVMKRKILLDSDSGAPSLPSLDLLAWQVRAKWLGAASHASDAAGFPVGALTAANRLNESAGFAHGNTARFWRTLLRATNEVKA